MAKDPAFLFYPGDYLRDTQCLSEKAQVAYDRIMCEHMRNICDDVTNIGITKDKLKFFTKRLNEDEINDLMNVLVKSGDIYQIEWAALSICKRKAYSANRAENRRKKTPKDMKTYVTHMENANENVIENENTNRDSIGGAGERKGNEQLLVPQMQQIWITSFPSYTQDRNLDFPALRTIADFIFKNAGVDGGYGNAEVEIKTLNTFQLIADQVGKDNFWVNKPLSSISKNIQEFYNKIKNPIDATPKQQNGRSSKIDDDKLKQKLAAKLNEWRQNSH